VKCLIPGCRQTARNKLAVRCRKPTTRAVWAPDSEAYLCKEHAAGGVDIRVVVEPTANRAVKVTYESGGQTGPTRTTPIKRSAA
jgi:hypothetical protein